MERPILLVTNRGPVGFESIDDAPTADAGPLAGVRTKRGAGGLVSGLAPLVAGTSTEWIAAAMTDGDRQVAKHGLVEAEDFRVRLVDIDPASYSLAYDVVCNATLWFLHHCLWDLSRTPSFDGDWRDAWDAYVDMNEAFASVVAQEAATDAIVMVQDYHLTLLAPPLREARPDLRLVHFHHTPFAPPDLFRVLPPDVGTKILEGLGAHHACGFHAERWADNFRGCCSEMGISDFPAPFVSPLGSDPDDIRATAASEACDRELASLDGQLGDRQLIVRVDRVELSKNILRGFAAFDDLLENRPDLRGRVVFGAFVYPSREAVPEYAAYKDDVEELVRSINERWSTADWTPILLDMDDNYPRSVAAMRAYDVLLVNPIKDGLNLVAKEGPLVNERDGQLVLSTEAGVWPEMSSAAISINPFDVPATTDALAKALALPRDERAAVAASLRELAEARTPADWLDDQIRAASS